MARTMEWQPRDYVQCIYAFSGPDGRIRFVGKSGYAGQALANFRTSIRRNAYPNSAVHAWGTEIGADNVRLHIIEKLMTYDSITSTERRTHFIELFSKSASPEAPLLNHYTGKTDRAVETREYKKRNRK